MRDQRLPELSKNQDIEWQIVSWLKDSARFVVNAHQRSVAADLFSSTGTSVWIFSTTGEAPRELRRHASASLVTRQIFDPLLIRTKEGTAIERFG